MEQIASCLISLETFKKKRGNRSTWAGKCRTSKGKYRLATYQENGDQHEVHASLIKVVVLVEGDDEGKVERVLTALINDGVAQGAHAFDLSFVFTI